MFTFSCSYKVIANTNSNELLLSVKGFVVEEYMDRVVSTIKSEIKKLKNGFVVINDISQLKPVSKKEALKFKKAEQYLIDKGASVIINL